MNREAESFFVFVGVACMGALCTTVGHYAEGWGFGYLVAVISGGFVAIGSTMRDK